MIRRIAPYFITAMAAALMTGVIDAPDAAAQTERKPPYWAALAKDEARMRVGPSLDYPSNWVYRRRNLPVKVVEIYPNWRKVEDPDGTQGWMHKRLLKAEDTAIVVGEIAEIRRGPGLTESMIYRAEPGVVGRVSNCRDGWCLFDVNGQRGYIRISSLWGATDAE